MLIGETVKVYRERLGWSQEHLAAVSGVSIRTIQRIENGASCKLATKLALASAFSITVDAFEPKIQLETISNHSSWWRKVLMLAAVLLLAYLYLLSVGLEYNPDFFIHTQALWIFAIWSVWVVGVQGFSPLYAVLKLLLGGKLESNSSLLSTLLVWQAKMVYVSALCSWLLISIPKVAFFESWQDLVGIQAGNLLFTALYALLLRMMIFTAQAKLQTFHMNHAVMHDE